MKKRYYITFSNKKIQVPCAIRNSKMTNYTIIDQMFPDENGIPKIYWDAVTKIMLAIKENQPQQWEDAGFELQAVIKETGDKKFNCWANHFFDVCYRLENKGVEKRKMGIEINIPEGELNFIVPSDMEINTELKPEPKLPTQLSKRYKLEKGIV